MAWQEGHYWLVGVDVVAWAAVVTLATFPRLGYRTRAGAFLVLWFAFAWVLLIAVGMAGSGIAWILVPTVLAGVFFGRRGASVGTVVLAATLVIAGFGVAAEAPWVGALRDWSLHEFLSAAGSVVFLAAMLGFSVATWVRGVESAHEAEAEARRRLQEQLEERERLEAPLREARQSRRWAASRPASRTTSTTSCSRSSPSPTRCARTRPKGRRSAAGSGPWSARPNGGRDLVARILAYGRSEGGERAAVELNRVLAETAPLVTGALPEPVVVRIESGPAERSCTPIRATCSGSS